MSLGSVLVTGGSGTLGKALAKRLLADGLSRRICIFSRGEFAQEEMKREFAGIDPNGYLRFFLGDVRSPERLRQAMQGVQTVIHAAAMKVVPACEYNPQEAVSINVIGTQNVCEAAISANVGRVMFISTDKSSGASTLYGATKFVAERTTIASNALARCTALSSVRYGNVAGSRGAAIPMFKKLVADGARVLPITDIRMTRFFWEVEDAVEFTLSSLGMMAGGEVFIPKMQARRIVDVAREIAPTLPYSIIGIRPGEKLSETMLSEDESINAVELEDRYVLCPFDRDWDRSHLVGAKPVPDGFRYCSDIAIKVAAQELRAAE